MKKHKHSALEIIVVIFTIIASIATLLVVPEIRRLFGLDQTSMSEENTKQPIKNTATFQFPARHIGNRQVANNGTEELILTSSQVAIGTADKFHDVLQIVSPPYTVFVIYGEINTQMSLYWSGWDLWENTTEEFIDEQITVKIQEVISSHPQDYDKRGYRVIKCYGEIENCETISTFP